MYEGIEALDSLERYGTISQAATHLRLTQSAVSKRIQTLQATLGFQVIEPAGRKVKITPRGLAFLEKARPLVAELNGLLHVRAQDESATLSIAVADSIASSWGPKVLRRAMKQVPGLNIEIHAHRSILALENVRSGRYTMALCTEPSSGKDLVCHSLIEEPMVLVPRAFGPKLERSAKLVTIEEGSATWQGIGEKLLKHPQISGHSLLRVESFQAAVQMVRYGFGNGLLPYGIAVSMGVPSEVIKPLKPAVCRKITLVARSSIAALEVYQRFQAALMVATNDQLRLS